MLGLIVVAILGGMMIYYRGLPANPALDLPAKLSGRLDKLWEIAQQSLRDRKYLRAEKALLTILRVDERNATAYNRLGILYAKQQEYKDAIECFEIAQSHPACVCFHFPLPDDVASQPCVGPGRRRAGCESNRLSRSLD